MEWVSRITTVALEMVLPGIAGQWLDERWKTGYLGLLGFAFGVTLGVWHLVQMTKPNAYAKRGDKVSENPTDSPPASDDVPKSTD